MYRWVIPALAIFLVMYVVSTSYYQNMMRPFSNALGYLARAETSQAPESMADYVIKAKKELPDSRNTVWLFPTAKVNFAIIQSQLEDIALTAASLDPQSDEYYESINGMRDSIGQIQTNIYNACLRLC